MYQRKVSNFIINKTFQFKYAAVAIGASFVSIMVLWFCIWLFQHSSSGQELTPDLRAAVAAFARYVTLRAVIFASFISLFSILISHKMAGPLYRFQKTLEAVTAGDLTARAYLRLGDDLNEVKEALNVALTSLHARVRQDKETAQKTLVLVEEILQTMKDPLTKEGTEGITMKLQRIDNNLREIGKRFKI